MTSSGPARNYPLRAKFAKFHEAQGATQIMDMNAGELLGYGEAASSTFDGLRQYAALGYDFSQDITMRTESTAERLLLEGKRAVVIIFTTERHPTVQEISLARQEVIPTAGALSSPKILMLRYASPLSSLLFLRCLPFSSV